MANHAAFIMAIGCGVPFCDPHSSSQRGNNDHNNWRIRWFLPNGTDFRKVADIEITEMERRRLGPTSLISISDWPRQNPVGNSIRLTDTHYRGTNSLLT